MKRFPKFYKYRTKGLWWFRIYGYGIHYKNIRYHPVLFSERNGFRKKLKIGRFYFGFLKPEKYLIDMYRNYGKTEEIRQYHRNEFPPITKQKDETLIITYTEIPTCEICYKITTNEENKDSKKFIGNNRYFCNEHLNKKMDW